MWDKDYPVIDSVDLNFCCGVTEIGGWGGDPDSYSYHMKYDDAVESIKAYQNYHNFIVATTIDSQKEARRALRDCGFTTVKSFEGLHARKIFFHYWRNPNV